MIADFVSGCDLYVFFEDGELEELEKEGSLDGVVEASEDPGFSEGDILFRYEEDMYSSRPGVAVYDSEDPDSIHGSEYDIEVVINDRIYSTLEDGEVYDNGVDNHQEVSSDAEVMFFPEGQEYEPGSEALTVT